jgi:hypothetical protein
MIELENVKYGAHTFDQAFNNNNDPYFVGAKTKGGAKALKTLDRESRGLLVKPGQKLTGAQRAKLNASLETYVEKLHSRGGKKPSKFQGLKDKQAILSKVKETLVKRAGVALNQKEAQQKLVQQMRQQP